MQIVDENGWIVAMQIKSKQQVKCRLRTGDEVMVMVGKSKGETGKIDRIDFKNNIVYVAGTNIYVRHTRPGGIQDEGGIIEKVMPMHWSNVQVIDPKSKKPTRIAYKVEDGAKFRVAKSGARLTGKS